MTETEQRMADFKKALADAFAEPSHKPIVTGGLLTNSAGEVDGARIGIELPLPRPAS